MGITLLCTHPQVVNRFVGAIGDIVQGEDKWPTARRTESCSAASRSFNNSLSRRIGTDLIASPDRQHKDR